MNDNFRIVMEAVDDDLLEEAMAPVAKRKRPAWILAAAACLVLLLSLPMLRPRTPSVSLEQLQGMGYGMTLPETVEVISYELVTLDDRSGAEARFLVGDTEYIYR